VETRTIVAAATGDADALADIVDDFMPTVLGAAYGLTGDWHDAGDVAQEAFATMVVRLGDLRDPAALPGWLMAITRNTARRHRRLELRDLHGPTPPSTPASEDAVIARDDARRVRRAVESLPPQQRLPIVLHYFAGHSLGDIAELCDLPLSTVKKRMRVARAHLREGIDRVSDIGTAVTPAAASDPSDVIRMYTAMRSGNTGLVERILDARPDLVDVRENWTRADSFAHRLPWTRGGGTPLLRAVERGDLAIVRLLLTRGADPNGSCSCDGGESPLWVAVLQGEREITQCLLASGARPSVTAFAGASAVDVARMRGFDDLAAALHDAGATSAASSEASQDPGCEVVPADATGIKAIDLWCPFPRRGLVHVTPGFGLGATVLISELSLRAARSGKEVVWTGFVQAPTDLGDVHHALAESALVEHVKLSMASPFESNEGKLAAFERGIHLAGDDAFLVVFAETGQMQAVEERLLALSSRGAVTLIVAPLDGSMPRPRLEGSPYLASITFDVVRARRHRWPAIGAESWSKVVPADTAELADRARRAMTDELDAYLSQPFYVAEPITGMPGETVPVDELRARVTELLCNGR
jgi:RNA polymerase sigma-70 factor (ECF subfamily)